jgi:hypothetical protein
MKLDDGMDDWIREKSSLPPLMSHDRVRCVRLANTMRKEWEWTEIMRMRFGQKYMKSDNPFHVFFSLFLQTLICKLIISGVMIFHWKKVSRIIVYAGYFLFVYWQM